METVRTYVAVITDPDPDVEGMNIVWFPTMPVEFEEFLRDMGWLRAPRTDQGAAGVWHRADGGPRIMEVHPT